MYTVGGMLHHGMSFLLLHFLLSPIIWRHLFNVHHLCTVPATSDACHSQHFNQKGHPAWKKLGVGLLVVTIWLELSTSYGSRSYYHLHHPYSCKIQNGDNLVPANPGPPGKIAVKLEREKERVAHFWATLSLSRPVYNGQYSNTLTVHFLLYFILLPTISVKALKGRWWECLGKSLLTLPCTCAM